MRPTRIPPVLFTLALVSTSFSQAVKDRAGAVRQDRATLENDSRWVYNEVDRGFAEAKRSGKPLLVVLRCVPCLACSGIDAQVLLQNTEVASLMEQFVCVRVINANALDLARFQFDYDLSFSTIFFNGDGTVYGRFGSWTHQKNAQDTSTASFQRALEAALAIHRAYPGNRAALAGKQCGPAPYRTPVDMPELSGKYSVDLDWNGKLVQSCVHCHQIGDALRLSYRNQNKPIPADLIYPMPPPETIGFSLVPDQVARVDSVTDNSIAAQAGLRPGDEIISLEGQPLVSIADVSWILHRSPESGSLAAKVRRGGDGKSLTLVLPGGWRRKSDISRRVGTWGMRGMATGGLSLQDLDDGARSRQGFKQDGMALLVKGVGQYGKHAAGKKAGFQKDDVIVEIDGGSNRVTESELIGDLLLRHNAGDQVKVVVRRGQDRSELTLPMQ